MNASRLLVFGFIFSLFASFSFAYPVVANTWNTNQIQGPSVYVPSSDYSGWIYNSYNANPGYPVMGGGVIYPRGYNSGYFYPSYNSYNSYGYNAYVSPSYPGHYVAGYYYGAPVHSTFDVGYSNGYTYVPCGYYSC